MTTPQADGRRLRSERSREAIVRALLALVGENVLEPTAQQVARRAGVDIRTVFRHFSDMESLYAEMDARLLEEMGPLARHDRPSGALEERARGIVATRAAAFERIAPYKRASNLLRRRSPFIETRHRALARALRDDLQRWLPEIASAPEDLAEALDVATSFEAWDRLRTDQRLGRARARAALERTVLALVRDLRPGA